MFTHRLLQRQIRRHLGPDAVLSPEVAALLGAVEEAYRQHDGDRRLTDRAMELSSRELIEVNDRLGKQNERNLEILGKLRASVRALHVDSVTLEGDDDLLGLVNTLQDLIRQRREAQAAMAEAQAAAEAASRAKSNFLANMSHEIRTPLNAILGMSVLLLDLPLSAEQREYVETIRKSGDGLLDVISHILDFSKIESGQLDLEAAPFDLRHCVEDVLDMFAFTCEEKGIDLGFYCDAGVPDLVEGDSARLRQILVNLVGNAVKFTERGGITVAVTATRDSAHWRLRFDIDDTGIGIPADRIDRLFKSFSQVDSSTTRRFGGTGLGLAICRRLVEMMDGHIGVTSTPEEGSTFRVDLRMASAAASPAVAVAAPVETAGRRVLIVDDNPVNRRILERQVSNWGMQPETVADGEAALARCAASPPFDLALVDFNMPGMDGGELAALMRARLGRACPALLLLTSRGVSLQDQNLDVTARLVKPVKPRELYASMLHALGARGGASDTPVRTPIVATLNRELASQHPMRILVAEDNAINQKVLLHILKRFGYQADAVENGRIALEFLDRQPYDLVIMDMQMPEMDGLDATRIFRRRVPKSEPPYILALTASALMEDYQACMEAGMHAFLSKPVRPDDLVEALLQAWAWLRTARAVADPV